MMKKTLIYILSEKRSGSTWLSYVLGAHSKAAYLGEYYRPFVDPEYTECDICKATDQLPCKILHGIHDVPIELAYDFAFDRYGKDILIDNGKEVTWIEKILTLKRFDRRLKKLVSDPIGWLKQERNFRNLDPDRYQIKLLHLIRDPRGWFASVKRRGNTDVVKEINRWITENTAMYNLAQQHGLEYMVGCYDYLATMPEEYFPKLCSFVGTDYEPQALEYWNFEHHGLGGLNGAGYNVLEKYKSAGAHTADESFYKMNAGKNFYDQRWKEQLSSEELGVFRKDESLNNLLMKFDVSLDDLERISS